MNVRFDHLYRDAGNNKLWGHVVFANDRGLDVAALRARLEEHLIDGQFFPRGEGLLPPLQFPGPDDELDHGWLEYVGMAECDEEADDVQNRDIGAFIDQVVVILEEFSGV